MLPFQEIVAELKAGEAATIVSFGIDAFALDFCSYDAAHVWLA